MPPVERLKVPHMGWNEVEQVMAHPLWRVFPTDPVLFCAQLLRACPGPSLLAGSVDYGVQADAALARDNLFAVQFHPEKSATAGLQLLRNFLEWNGQC